MIGLQETTATQAGFLIQTVNILVPVILLASGQPVRKSVWLAAPLCITGVILLSSTEGGGAAQGSLTGDAFILASAFCYAMFTVGRPSPMACPHSGWVCSQSFSFDMTRICSAFRVAPCIFARFVVGAV
jgi:drug/metabolite transporter (DMT)-like permease